MRRTIALLLVLSMLTLAACGGSGSSGFDVTPGENAVIAHVLASGECGESGSLVICPASETSQATPGQPAPTPTAGRDVQVDLPESAPVPCSLATDAQSCAFVLSFAPAGLPPDAVYRAAARRIGSDGEWLVGESAVLSGELFVVPVEVPEGAGEVEVAVLVFTGGMDTVPGPVATLGETGASFAFVVGNVSVAPALARRPEP